MFKAFGFVVSLTMMLQSPVASTPSLFKPIGKWLIDDEDVSCGLSRQFNDGAQTLLLGLKPSFDLKRGQLFLVFSGAETGPKSGLGSITLRPSAAVVPAPWRAEWLNVSNQHARKVWLNGTFWTVLPSTSEISVSVGEQTPTTIQIGPSAPLMRAFVACRDAQLRKMGADPATMIWNGGIRRVSELIEYPDEAAQNGHEGRAAAIASVDESGKVSSCKVVESSKSPILDRSTCIIVRRAKFEPSSQGAATRYVYYQVFWSLPTD